MKTKAQEFFESQLITDANSVIDKTRQKYSRMDLIKFAQVFADQCVKAREGEILPNDMEVAKWYDEMDIKVSSSSTAIYLFRNWLKDRLISTPPSGSLSQVEQTQAKQSNLLYEVIKLRNEYNEKVAFLEREIPLLTTARERIYAISMKTMGIEFLLKINDIIKNE